MSVKRPTSFDIAALAGVSQATVSRALSNSGSVSDAVRQRVVEAAQKLNYSVDVNARKLRSQRINTIAVLISEDMDSSDSPINPFFMPIIGHIVRYANEKGIDVLCSLQKPSSDWGLEYGFSRKADGIIFLGYRVFETSRHKINALTEMGEPWVVFGADTPNGNRIRIGSDNEGGAYMATRHLLASGRRRIVFSGETLERHSEFYHRYRGYCRALKEFGLEPDPDLQAHCFMSRDEGAFGVDRLIDNGLQFDSIFAVTDILAMGALQALNRHGKKVPEDVALIGFDDIWAAECTSPALSTVRQDTKMAAEALVDTLISIKNNDEVEDKIIHTQLVLRDTA